MSVIGGGYEPEDGPLDPRSLARVAALTPAQVAAVDAALMAATDGHWRKIAYVVAVAMTDPAHVPGIPEVFYADRVRGLVRTGTLEHQGALSRMRSCEVRKPAAATH